MEARPKEKAPLEESPEAILERALAIARERRPKASAEKHRAFTQTVLHLVTGRGEFRQSVRERAACSLHAKWVGKCSVERATEVLLDKNGPIFGPLSEVHLVWWTNEWCFDDDPVDIEALKKMEKGWE